jgi:DNA-binding CsgD family transcriptional regulator
MPSGQRWLRVAELVGELAELSVADLDEAADHLLRCACEIVGVTDAMLGFAKHDPRLAADDPLHGWRPPSPYRPRRFGPHADHDAALLDAWYGSVGDLALDPAAASLARSSGSVRSVLHSDVLPERLYQRAAIYELLDVSGISDRLIGGRPIAHDVELLVVMYRRNGEARFGELERHGLLMIMAALTGIGRRIALAQGLIDARRPLIHRERETLHHLLSGRSEKQAAAAMALSERTLHHRVTALYQKFGVQSRAELMALFLRSTADSGIARAAQRRSDLGSCADDASARQRATRTDHCASTRHRRAILIAPSR